MSFEMKCTHCGKPGADEYALIFQREKSTEMELALCQQCIDLITAEKGVRQRDP